MNIPTRKRKKLNEHARILYAQKGFACNWNPNTKTYYIFRQGTGGAGLINKRYDIEYIISNIDDIVEQFGSVEREAKEYELVNK